MMQNRIRFVTLFPNCPNYGLAKDVGQIPYVLGKNHSDITTSLVTYNFNKQGENLDKVAGLKIIQCPSVFHNDSLSGLVYLLKNAKKIDWLNIYHCGRRSYFWAKVYKFLNPKGKVYLKLDLDFVSCDLYDLDEKERKAFAKIIGFMDLVSVESIAVRDRILPYAKCDIKTISNGYCKAEKVDFLKQKRNNTFITVGRLGTKQKATEVLLEAFAMSAKQHNWNLKLVGSVEPEFQIVKEQFYQKYPNLKDRVIFTGHISDREKLYQEYCSSKVFILPSRWESFGLVGPEALSCGCRVIISDQIPPMREMTGDGKYGKIVPVDDIEALSRALYAATNEEYSVKLYTEIANYADEHFSWENICEKLYAYLKES